VWQYRDWGERMIVPSYLMALEVVQLDRLSGAQRPAFRWSWS
jgi:hypothetical protein